ncbi:DUF2313 domain-containing protein, partial [Burkholderia gladioli]|jgi:uncharacterized protein YmfQ (DUF2313 family)|uniref:putative phage tail protein n=1 Tax=Burkholderia TaxID=32008 RepID=UPI000F51B25F|nr:MULTISPECIES: putative phage tail protein [Burkholderia]RQZ74790.1 DUF2313 domain-containing protein [Burkholderia glumae]
MNSADLLALLLPPVSYDTSQPRIGAELKAQGAALDAELQASGEMLDAITPSGSSDFLADYERDYDLPDPALGADQTLDDRLAILLERINETGRMDRDGFLFVASNLGFSVSMNEFRPWRVNSPVGRPLYGDDWMFVWQLTASGETSDQQRRLIESVMRRIAPAHTVLQFNYAGEPNLFLLEEGDGFLLTEDNEYLDLQ